MPFPDDERVVDTAFAVPSISRAAANDFGRPMMHIRIYTDLRSGQVAQRQALYHDLDCRESIPLVTVWPGVSALISATFESSATVRTHLEHVVWIKFDTRKYGGAHSMLVISH